MISLIFLILFCNLCLNVLSIPSRYSITPNQSLAYGQTLVSPNETFALGFFTPNGSTYSYLGIWYNKIPVQTIVWVANRQSPLKTRSNITLSLSSEGNLAIRNLDSGNLVLTEGDTTNPVVQLLDSGNLVLTEGVYRNATEGVYSGSNAVWQSFDYPSDTLLPGMSLGWDRRLTSWLSSSDPSPGPYSFGVPLNAAPELYIWNVSTPMSRVDPSIYGVMSQFDDPIFSLVDTGISDDGKVYYNYEMLNSSDTQQRIVLNQFGVATLLSWQSPNWTIETTGDDCDNYGRCGSFAICNSFSGPICSCFRNFEPKFRAKWDMGDFSGGCVPRTPLDCGHGDTFIIVSGVNLPTTREAVLREDLNWESCRDWCILNCSCVAFSFPQNTNGFIIWFGDLVDTKAWKYYGEKEDLYVRVATPELGIYPTNRRKRRHAPVAILVAVSLAIIILCFLVLLTWIRCKPKWTKLSAEKTTLPFGIGRVINLRESEKPLMSPLYPLSSIIQATDNFSYVNKLGEGGFGPVYKGKLIDGQEIAVKRLAAKSGQGREEFENEIILIAKLQHTNLVRLLGYCIHGEEKILIYEYMPNKSLDYFLYDTTRRAQLYWSKRRHIIEGISQGLLYLHKHSRPRIIHRDLKASNILLDADMNPKISDFGLARIFGTNETEANTKRVVGTYGYMSPEYAAEGRFSVKSDVFSFGVLLLEIVSGCKNASYHRDGNTLNLLGYAWELWKEAKLQELVDPSFDENCPKHEISRYIHIALMCVQENAIDRPNMSAVIFMLSSDSAIADPKQPAFFNVRNPAEEEFHSINEATMTTINGR